MLKDILLCSYDTSSVSSYRTSIKANIYLLYFMLERLLLKKYISEKNLYKLATDLVEINIFLAFEPKIRFIMEQGIYDKIINHYITRYILMPKLEKYLGNRNCATRKVMVTSYAIKLLKKDIEIFKKYNKFYFLKIDISKYFYSLDHEVIISIVKP